MNDNIVQPGITRKSALILISRVHPNPENPRRQLGDKTKLAESLDDLGIISPLIVRPDHDREGHVVTICGDRRLEVLTMQHLDDDPAYRVPCIVLDNIDATTAFTLAIADNVAREGLSQPDLLVAVSRLQRTTPWSDREIARRLGLSNGTVSMYRRVGIDPDVAHLVLEYSLPITVADEICRVPDHIRDGVIAAVADGQLHSMSDLRRFVARFGMGSTGRARHGGTGAKSTVPDTCVAVSTDPVCAISHAGSVARIAQDAAATVLSSAHDAMSSPAACAAWAAAGVDCAAAAAAGWGYLDEPVSAVAGDRETIDLSAGLLVPVRRGHTDDLDALVVLGADGRWQITVGGLS